jgi:hypothetical protein
MATKHEILQKTGVTSETFYGPFKRFFGSECEPGAVPQIWIAQFLQTLTNKIRQHAKNSDS